MALNQAYQEQGTRRKAASTSKKSLEEDIIDLTIEDSDAPSGRSRTGSRPKSSLATKLEQAAARRPPITPPVLSPTSGNVPSRRKTMTAVVSSPSKDEPTPRPRSAPTAPVPELPLVIKSSISAESRRSTSSDEVAAIRRPTLPSRVRRIVQSPSQEVDDSESLEEREVYQAMMEDSGASFTGVESDVAIPALPATSSDGSPIRASPELIPPLRRSLRHSSPSSHSEMDNIVPFTDAESPPDSSPSPGPEEPAVALSYGGFKALTWQDHKKDFRNLGLKCYSAKDLQTTLPDSINRLSEYTRMDRGMKDIFRAYMLENIVEDEAGAPDIEILNNVDHEPTPLFEFIYSNRVWYGEGVPLPDYSKLKGCDCIGRCDPKSKTCACAKRQRKYLGNEDGCVYEKNGRLKHPRYPIFECNELCSCDDDCRNRVGMGTVNCFLVG